MKYNVYLIITLFEFYHIVTLPYDTDTDINIYTLILLITTLET